MPSSSRAQVVFALLRGLGVAVAITLGGMVLLTILVILTPLSDSALTALNQVLKVTALFFGAMTAVGRGGQRGFALGAVVGLLYMVLGYALYCLLDGQLAPAGQLALEFGIGALLGAISGSISANLKPAKKRPRVRAARRASKAG